MQDRSIGSGSARYRTIFISDVHLGYRGSRAHDLLEFLRNTECDYLYLVGDIIDLWQLKRRPFWPQAHNDVLRTILGKAKHGTQVIFIPGNHDEKLKTYCGHRFGNISIELTSIHQRADGSRLLVLHGDQFDAAVASSPWLGMLGAKVYDWLLTTNTVVNVIRRRCGFGYWSLAGFLKHKVKNAIKYINRYEQVVAAQARKKNVDGVVCGHIHRAEIAEIEGLAYHNCGDWVESCTALVEHADGAMELLYCSNADPVTNLQPAQQIAA